MPIFRRKDHVLPPSALLVQHVVLSPDDGHKDARNMLRQCQ